MAGGGEVTKIRIPVGEKNLPTEDMADRGEPMKGTQTAVSVVMTTEDTTEMG